VKIWELWLSIGFIILLFICSGFFYFYSSTFHLSTLVNYDKLAKLIDSGNELHLSAKKTKELLELQISSAEHHNRETYALQKVFKNLSVLLLSIGVAQISLFYSLYKKIIKLKHNQTLEQTE
jgi:hypothetical protein